MKRSPLRKKSKEKISTLQNKLWELCRKIIRKKYPAKCYTCGVTGLIGSNFQTGHVPWPKAALGAYLKYDLRVMRPQCFRCNINFGGMGAEAYKIMLKEIGEEKMAELERDRQKIVKAYDHYQKIYLEYQQLLTQLDAEQIRKSP